MAVSRRLRFEILRRDGHTCRYCGAKAPDVELTVDHVVAVTLGGGDEPNNLVTACQPCNAGKSSIPADAAIVEDVDATAMLMARAVEQAAEVRRSDAALVQAIVGSFFDAWGSWRWGETYENPGGVEVPRDDDWENSVERFVALGLNEDDILRFVDKAMRSRASSSTANGVWKFFCGCCWRELADRQELARRLIEDGEV